MKVKTRYCLLAKSIPEYSKRDGTLYTCSIGLSPEFGLIRIYPLPPSGMKKWGIYEVEIEKNKLDNRKESWKLSSYTRKNNWIGFSEDIKYIGDMNKKIVGNILSDYISPSISQLNTERKSIGLISCSSFNLKWCPNERFINTNQIGLFEDVEIADFCSYTKETKNYESRILFNDMDGIHNLQYNEWGVYEYQRKYSASMDAFRFLIPSQNSCVLIGNMNSHRSSWIALGIFDIINQMVLL